MADFVDQVEQAMTRMFDPSTSNAEKQSIEQQLQTFKKGETKYGLRQCYHMLTLSKNQYVLWFASSMLEEIVQKRWKTMSPTDQSNLSQFVIEQLLSNAFTLPPFVFTKLAVVYITIGKLDWPDRFPDFFSRIEALVMNESSARVGLCLMRLCSEEFVKQNETIILTARKKRIKELLTGQLPLIMTCLGNQLLNISIAMQDVNISPAKFQEYDAIATLALKAILQFVEWAPIGQFMSKHLVSLLFQFTTYRGVKHEKGAHNEMLNSSIAALECITTMIAKKCVPCEFEIFVLELTSSLMTVLQSLTEDEIHGNGSNMIDFVGEEYLDKLTEFLSVFLDNHLARLERFQDFRLNDFLQLLLTYTCRQPHSVGFVNCINLWIHFVSHIEESRERNMHDTSFPAELEACENGLITLSCHVFDRIQFASNCSQLEELDDQHSISSPEPPFMMSIELECGSEMEQPSECEGSEYEEFIKDCVTLIVRTAELPNCAAKILSIGVPKIQNSLSQFYQVHTQAFSQSASKAEIYAVLDMASVLTTIAKVGSGYYAFASTHDILLEGYQLLKLVLDVSEYISKHRLHSRGFHFERLYLACITSVQQCCTCLYALHQNNLAQNEITDTSNRIIDMVCSVLDATIVPTPEVIMLSAIDLISTISKTVPSSILNGERMQRFRTFVHTMSLPLPFRVQARLYGSMSRVLLPSSLAIRSPEWKGRQAAYIDFAKPIIASITEVCRTLENNDQRMADDRIMSQISRDAIIMGAFANAVIELPKPAKSVYHQLASMVLPSSLTLMRKYMHAISITKNHNMVLLVQRIEHMFIEMFCSIGKELGASVIQEVVSNFLALFEKHDIANGLGTEGVSLISHFLLLMNVIAAEPTNVFHAYIQGILDLFFGPLKHFIFDSQFRDALLPYFLAVAQQILEKHFRYFVSSTLNTENKKVRNFTSDVALKYFMTLFEAIGSVLQRNDLPPRICRQILRLLTRVNQTHNLYANETFKATIREAYIQTILQHLVCGTMNLLLDESCQTLFDLASTDLSWFYTSMIPQFISTLGVNQETAEVLLRTLDTPSDYPTFFINIVAFGCDYRVFNKLTN